jgi:hypothetical protein
MTFRYRTLPHFTPRGTPSMLAFPRASWLVNQLFNLKVNLASDLVPGTMCAWAQPPKAGRYRSMGLGYYYLCKSDGHRAKSPDSSCMVGDF